ncbi:MAG: hypothetical protein KUG64_10135 [Cycloclasticus sp.]|nr:hypothetical protein [Cycloclasticus sp.]
MLFCDSVGPTDFSRRDQANPFKSIKENLFPLGDDVRFIPEYDPMGTHMLMTEAIKVIE